MRPSGTSPSEVNAVLNELISSGKYREALALPPRYLRAGKDVPTERALIEINLAEADYNLGDWSGAGSRLDALEPRIGGTHPIVRAGHLLQRAWILAHMGQAQQALAVQSRVDVDAFPQMYVAEFHFTRAAIFHALGRFDEAEAASLEGEHRAHRLSSFRNALFLIARIAAGRGDWEESAEVAALAATHRFRGQGGDGLLLWGDVLGRLGRSAEARAAWGLCVKRDPQSASAGVAAERMKAAP